MNDANATASSAKLVLVVDDNPGDLELIRHAFRAVGTPVAIEAAMDGEGAIARLVASTLQGGAQRPDLILLDLNLPRLDGREVLARIKADEELRRIPVIVMTSSKAEEDVVRSYDLGANCYITKSLDIDELFRVVRSIQDFWLGVVTPSPR